MSHIRLLLVGEMRILCASVWCHRFNVHIFVIKRDFVLPKTDFSISSFALWSNQIEFKRASDTGEIENTELYCSGGCVCVFVRLRSEIHIGWAICARQKG